MACGDNEKIPILKIDYFLLCLQYYIDLLFLIMFYNPGTLKTHTWKNAK